MDRVKIAIVGAGNVGAQAAFLLGLSGLGDIALIDIAEDLAQGKGLDLAQAFTIFGRDVKVEAGGYGLLKDSNLVIVTAGLARRPDMSREDLLAKNKQIIEEVAGRVVELAADAVVIMVTNPLDIMTYVFWKKSGLPHQKVLGMGGLLDSGRLSYFLAQATGAAAADVQAMVIGPHNDMMVPLSSRLNLAGLDETVFSQAALKAKNGGAEIVGLLKTGSAFFAPAGGLSRWPRPLLTMRKNCSLFAVMLARFTVWITFILIYRPF